MKRLECAGPRVRVPYMLIVIVGLLLQMNCVMQTSGGVTTLSFSRSVCYTLYLRNTFGLILPPI